MASECCMKRVWMYIRPMLLITVILLIAHSWGDAYQQETRGYFSGHKNNEITIVLLQNQGKESFRVTGETRVINVGLPMEISRIPKDSRVKVISEHGTALEIHVEEVPR